MATVKVPCGHCGKVMGVRFEHLGGDVRCPSCKQVMKAPLPERNDDRESILGSSEASDDLLGGPRQPPVVELPPPESETSSPSWVHRVQSEPGQPSPVSVASRPRRSRLGAFLLILLVPYSIISTGFIAWLLYNQRKNQVESLERMFDPAPKDGGPKMRVKHDVELPAKLRTSLAKAIQIGDLEVTPLKVVINGNEDLVLTARMRNTSTKTVFNPFPDSFLHFARAGMDAVRPYTFLESGEEKIYGGFASWRRQGKTFDGVLGPGEEMMVTLSTMDQQRPQVRRVLQRDGPHLWRLHVRRGFIDVRDEPHSATAVIGVEFPTSAIEKPDGGA